MKSAMHAHSGSPHPMINHLMINESGDHDGYIHIISAEIIFPRPLYTHGTTMLHNRVETVNLNIVILVSEAIMQVVFGDYSVAN